MKLSHMLKNTIITRFSNFNILMFCIMCNCQLMSCFRLNHFEKHSSGGTMGCRMALTLISCLVVHPYTRLIEPGTLLLWGDGANHHSTVQPLSCCLSAIFSLTWWFLNHLILYFLIFKKLGYHISNWNCVWSVCCSAGQTKYSSELSHWCNIS